MILIKDANIVNEGSIYKGSVLLDHEKIQEIFTGEIPGDILSNSKIISGEGKYLIPGVIDDHVHFREPGFTHKADISTESAAAVAGGVTSFMDMPNTKPQATTLKLIEEKFKTADEKSLANFSFYIGATNDNMDELLNASPKEVCGIKVFMGASTGNMLVDNNDVLDKIFSLSKNLVAVHCEDEKIIQENIAKYRNTQGENIPVKYHAEIRSAEACYKSSSFAVALAKKHNTRLHLLHLSTARELELLDNTVPAKDKRITAEACVHHLWFDESDYEKHGTLIKWNPSIKTIEDKESLLEAVIDNRIDIIATDHAPHLAEEKNAPYFQSMSGGPLVQHSLSIMLELYRQKKITFEKIVEKMCHLPADVFKIVKRGYIRKGFYADLALVNMNQPCTVSKENILYKCGWSPFEGVTFHSKVTHTFVNGTLVFENGSFNKTVKGQALSFLK
ncbi:MAG: dihydroorotase [Bacteroidia bacterium]|nr:dihydroorotase [Bacteroidia bacterium]